MDPREPTTMRRRTLRRLMERTRAGVAQFYRLVKVGGDGPLHLSEPCAVGPDAVAEALSKLDGAPYESFEYDMAHAPPFNSFALHPADSVPTRVRDEWWQRLGLRDALGVNLSRSNHYVGTVFLYRLAGQPGFTVPDLDTANGLVRWLRTQLEEAEQRETLGRRMEGVYVFAPDGRVRYAPAGRIPERLADTLGSHVRDFVTAGASSDCVVAGHLVRMQRLDGDDGPAVIVSAARTEPVSVDGVMKLTPLKRRIASFAAQGATVPEIARTMGRSPETIRTHLKKIYEQLGVGSRIELAEACRNVWR